MKNDSLTIPRMLIILVTSILANFSFAQIPSIQWQKSYGGIANDIANSIKQTSDGGYIVAGRAELNNGDITGNHGGSDFWIVKMDASGILQWQKSFGGTGSDQAKAIQQTSDGGYIVVGNSTSHNGDVSVNYGNYDIWIVKLDATGSLQWQKTLGGSSVDDATSIQQSNDGGYVVAGYTLSNDIDVTGNHGNYDMWIAKLNSVGDFQWQRALGGASEEESMSMEILDDGGYILAGRTTSNNTGDVTNYHGDYDIWVVRLNSSGVMQWQKTLGGSSGEGAYSIKQTTDGGFVLTGWTASTDGDVTNNNGSIDIWVIKLDISGSIQWQKTFGGSSTEESYAILQALDGGYLVVGNAISTDGDVTSNLGLFDYWLLKLNSSGSMQWQKSLGGSLSEIGVSIQQSLDGSIVVAGYTESNDNDVSGNHGGYDYWIVKLCEATSLFYEDLDNDGYGNLTNSISACSAPLGYVSNSLDCDDANRNINPSAIEICNGIDDDCDSIIDEGLQIIPSVNIIAIPLGTNCNGNNLQYTASALNTGGGAVTYDFRVNGNSVQTGSSNIYSGSLSGGDIITCTITVAGGTCLISATAISNAITQPPYLTAVCSNNNPALYFGYTGDQTATIKVVPTGGQAPYSVSITMNRPLNCNVITSSGDETWSGTGGTTINNSCPLTGSGLTPISTKTGVADGSYYSISVTLMQDALFTATVTDANGCTVSCTTTIHAEDVRCFAGNSGNAKVTLCHQTGSSNNPCTKICVSESAVAAHLAHGDFLGNCTPNCIPPLYTRGAVSDAESLESDVFSIRVIPNPTDSYFTLDMQNEQDKQILVDVYDALGRIVQHIESHDGKLIKFGENLKSGIYMADIRKGVNRKTVKLLKL